MMPGIINIESGKLETLNDDAIADAILAGTHAYPAGARVPVKNPDGQLVSIPAERVQAAFQSGYQSYGPRQEAIDQAVAENDNWKGSLKVAAEGAFDEALFGVPGLIEEHQEDDLARAKREAIKSDHDGANIVGRGLGLGANLFLGGPVFKGAAKAGQATTEAVSALASRIGTAGAGAVGTRAANSAAKSIVSKMAGGAVEGALISAPHALTEAALGNPELAGESLLWGGGIGALLGGGGAAAGELLGLTGRHAKKGYDWLGGKAPTAENITTRVGEYATGVPRETIEKYIANKDRIKAAEGISGIQITDDIDAASAKYKDAAEAAKQDFKAKEELAEQALREAQADLNSTRPSLANSDAIMLSVDSVKEKLGVLTQKADEALEDAVLITSRKKIEPITWRTQDVLSQITRARNKLRPKGADLPITAEQMASVRELDSLAERIKAGYGKELDGLQMRDLMRTIRSSNPGGYGRDAGEFGTHLSNALLEISEGMSERLKNKLGKYGYTDYETIMNEMSPMARNLREMSELFGADRKAFSTLGRYASTGDPITMKTLKEYDRIHGTTFLDDLEKYRIAKKLHAESKLKDLRAVLVPGHHAAAEMAGKEFDRILAQNEPMSYLMRNKIRPGAKLSKESERALAHLSVLEGHKPDVDDFVTRMADRRVLDSFDAAHIQGSRRVNAFGAATGGLVGSVFGPAGAAVGAAVGGGIGYIADIDGGKILRRMIDGETMLGPQFLEKAMKKGGEKLDRISEVLGNMKKRATTGGKYHASPMDTARMDVIKGMVSEMVEPEETKDKQTVHSKINERLSEWVSNPALMQEHVMEITGQVGRHGAPNAATISAQKLFTAVNYLNTHMPKPPRQNSPFAPPVRWKPSSFQLKAFEEKFEAVADPFRVLDHLENGTLTRNHMEAIKTVYPALHGVMQRRVFNAVAEDKLLLNYTDRLKLSLVMDMPLDLSMQNIGRHQKTFAQLAEAQEKSAQGGNFAPKVTISSQYASENMKRGK